MPLVTDMPIVLKVHGVRVWLVRDLVRPPELGDEARIALERRNMFKPGFNSTTSTKGLHKNCRFFFSSLSFNDNITDIQRLKGQTQQKINKNL